MVLVKRVREEKERECILLHRRTFFYFSDGIVATMKAKAGPSHRVLETVADYEKFLEHNDHSIIGTPANVFKEQHEDQPMSLSLGYFDSEANPLKDDLVKVAGQLSEKFRFAYTTAKELLSKVGHSK